MLIYTQKKKNSKEIKSSHRGLAYVHGISQATVNKGTLTYTMTEPL